MIDDARVSKELLRLEAHVAWVRQNLGDRPTLEWRLAEMSKLRARIAVAAPTKCQVAWHSE